MLRLRQVGPGLDGLWTLLLSNLILLGGASLSLWPLWRRVRRIARHTLPTAENTDWLVVLGYALREDQILPEYAQRLARARNLLDSGVAQRVLLVGGRTGKNRLSEAEAGRNYLLDSGVAAELIHLEDTSRHTLENLHRARAQYALCEQDFVLISSRYHLARCAAMAEGLSLQPRLCAAEATPQASHGLAELREAYYLHWYYAGKYWSRLTRNRKSLARIS